MTIEKLYDGTEVEVESGKSYIAVKKCRMLRSGVQLYGRDEVPQELLSELPEDRRNEKVFRVYRKPEAIIKHLDDFNYIAFVNGHPPVDVTPDNYKELAIGKVGGNASVKCLKDGNVYVENDLVFDSREAYEDYKNGKVELSIGLEAMWRVSDSPDYDFEVYDFTNVNHLALVPRGRAGGLAKVLDRKAVSGRGEGGYMPKFLKFFGVGEQKEDIKFSQLVFDAVTKVRDCKTVEEADAAESSVYEVLDAMCESPELRVLRGMVSDSLGDVPLYEGMSEETRGKIADALDALYKKCADASDAATKEILDACGGKEKDETPEKQKLADEKDKEDEKKTEDEKPEDKKDEKKEDEKKAEDEKPEDKKEDEKKTEDGCGGKQKDADELAALVKDTVEKALKDSVSALVEESVAKALGVDKKKIQDKGLETEYTAADLAINAWGSR